MMRESFRDAVLLSYSLVFIVFFSLLLFGRVDVVWISSPDVSSEVYSGDINCSSVLLNDTVSCLVSYVDSFFVYNRTDDSMNLSIDDLRSRGGDCKDWSEFYLRELSFYNVSGEIITFRVNDTSAHAKVLVYKDRMYCDIDQLDWHCVRFK